MGLNYYCFFLFLASCSNLYPIIIHRILIQMFIITFIKNIVIFESWKCYDNSVRYLILCAPGLFALGQQLQMISCTRISNLK